MPTSPTEQRSASQRVRGALLRTAFHLLYHQFAWAYDWVSRTFFRNQWRTWQRQVLPLLRDLPGGRVLEIGAGTGDLHHDLLRAGFKPLAIDLSPSMIAQALKKSKRKGLQSGLRLARARTQALPFKSASFDAVVSTFPSDYIVDPRTLAEIQRVLRPGGRLVVVPGAQLLPTDSTNRALERFAGVVYGDKNRRQVVEQRATMPELFPLLAPRLQEAGLLLDEQRWQRLPTSVVYVISAHKPGAGEHEKRV